MTRFKRMLAGVTGIVLLLSQAGIPVFAEESTVQSDVPYVSEETAKQEDAENDDVKLIAELNELRDSIEQAREIIFLKFAKYALRTVSADRIQNEMRDHLFLFSAIMAERLMEELKSSGKIELEWFAAEREQVWTEVLQLSGDVNSDGQITVADGVMLARVVAEDTTVSISEQGLANADVNGDGEITANDTTALLKRLANT